MTVRGTQVANTVLFRVDDGELRWMIGEWQWMKELHVKKGMDGGG